MGQKHAKQTYEVYPQEIAVKDDGHSSYRRSEISSERRANVLPPIQQNGRQEINKEEEEQPSTSNHPSSADSNGNPKEVETLIRKMVNQEVVRRVSAAGEEELVNVQDLRRLSTSIQSRYEKNKVEEEEEEEESDGETTTSSSPRENDIEEDPKEHEEEEEENISIETTETLNAFEKDIESYESERKDSKLPSPPPYSESDPIRKEEAAKLVANPRLEQIRSEEPTFMSQIRNSQTQGNEVLFEIVGAIERDVERLRKQAHNFRGRREGSEFLTIRTELEENEAKLRNVRSGLSNRLDRRIAEDLDDIQRILNDRE